MKLLDRERILITLLVNKFNSTFAHSVKLGITLVSVEPGITLVSVESGITLVSVKPGNYSGLVSVKPGITLVSVEPGITLVWSVWSRELLWSV